MFNRLRPLVSLVRRVEIPWLLITAASILTLMETAASLSIPMFTRDLIQQAGLSGVSSGVLTIMATVLILKAAASGVSLYLLSRAGEQMTAYLRYQLYARLVRLPMKFHDNSESGSLVSRTISDTTSVQELLTVQVVSLLSGLVSMIGSVVILWFLDWQLTVVMFTTVLVGVLMIIPVAAMLHAVAKQTQESLAKFSGRMAEVLGEIRLVKSTCAETQECERANGFIETLRKLGLKEAKILAVLGPTMTLAMTGSMVVILSYGGARVATGEITVGTLVAFVLYLFQIVIPMIQLSTFFAALSKAAGAAEYLSGLFDEPVEDVVQDGATPVGSQPLQFKQVEFSYEQDKPLMRDFCLSVPDGKVTALVGPSGSGKTTVLGLLERLYLPQEGEISFGDRPIDELQLEAWRRRIGYVSQEVPLVSGTVRDNLCFGLSSQPSEMEINDVLQAARADRFVAELSQGLETQVGERGVKLSGGQRQRLAIARAFLVDPAILMLDEATANLDAESEVAIREALRELMRGRTTLVVAHRLSTVIDADQIAVIEEGEVTGVGRHEELMASHELYRTLVQQQELT